MINLSAKTRETSGKKTEELRKKGIIPGVLYGPKTKNVSVEVILNDFEKVYKEAGESSLINLEIGDKKFLVLIHDLDFDAISGKPTHVDFYQPKLDEEIKANVPLVFEGEALAVKDLGGTLVKNIQELEVKALPQNLPHEIRVNINKLATFEDSITVKELILPANVKTARNPLDIVALVTPPQKVEEELEKPVEEKVEEVAKAGEEKKEEVAEEPEAK